MELAEFQSIYETCIADCYRVARHVIHDVQLAEDVVQNVFTAFWHGDARFDPARGSVRGWLLMITHHKAVDLVRRNQRHRGPALSDEDLGQRRSEDNVEEQGTLGARADHVAQALAKLTHVQRQVILLSYYGGLSQSEIANQTGIALGTVKTRMLYAMKQLRADLDLATLAIDEGWYRPALLDTRT